MPVTFHYEDENGRRTGRFDTLPSEDSMHGYPEWFVAYGECGECGYVGDMTFYTASEGKRVAICPVCSCETLESAMPEYPGERETT